MVRHFFVYSVSSNCGEERNGNSSFWLTVFLQGVKFWNPIVIAAFSGSLFLFSRAFLSSGPHDDHLALNLTQNRESGHFDSTLNLSTAKPGVLYNVSLPIIDNIKNGTSYMPQMFLGSDTLGEESSQVTTPSLAPVTRSDVSGWDINQSFSSRLLSNSRAQLRTNHPNQNGIVDKDINSIYDSKARHPFDSRYDLLEPEPFFSMEESGDGGQIFALKVWLDPKEFPGAKIGKVEICQASGGIQCWPDSHTHRV